MEATTSASQGVVATAAQRAALGRFSARALAAAAGVSHPTALAAKAGEPVRPICLQALLDAAARLTPPAPQRHGVAVCIHCAQGAVHRRDVCRSCYRKLMAAGIALPERHPTGRVARTLPARLYAWVRALAPGHRELLRKALEAA